MKKHSWLFCISIFFLFTACDLLLFKPVDDSKIVSTVVYLDENESGNVYLTKLNKSSRTVNGQKSGYISNTSQRSANEDTYISTDSFMQDLNRKAGLALYQAVSRSAGSERAVLSGYSERTFAYQEFFYSYVSKNNNTGVMDQISANKKYEGSHCLVYADSRNTSFNLSDTDYENLGKKFDSLYAKEVEIIGDPLYEQYNSNFYVSCNQKIIILVSDLYGDGEGQTVPSGTVGYFYQGDLFRDDFLYNRQRTHSNQCEMFYIDSLFLEKRPGLTYSTLVHEFNHMINYVVKTLKKMNNETIIKASLICDLWFTEMLSMTTEDMFQVYLGIQDKDSPKSRIQDFGIGYNYGFKDWDNLSNDNTTVDFIYANTYAFGAFLARNFGGVPLISEIAKNEYINEKSITMALKKLNPDIEEIDFNYALQKFTLCILNTEENDEGGKKYYSLNKSAGNASNSSLGFSKIDITSTITIKNKTYLVPFIYNGELNEMDIYPYGFSIHLVGSNLNSFTLTTWINNGIDYFYNIK